MARPDDSEYRSFSIPSTLAGLELGLKHVEDWLQRYDVGQETEDRVNLVFEEIVTNITRYAFGDKAVHSIAIALHGEADALTLVFYDSGRPFDPRAVPRPPKPDSLDDAPIGGRGLLLVNATASRVDYERTADGRNCLTIVITRFSRA